MPLKLQCDSLASVVVYIERFVDVKMKYSILSSFFYKEIYQISVSWGVYINGIYISAAEKNQKRYLKGDSQFKTCLQQISPVIIV